MVKRIFHFSDFHINPDCGSPKDSDLFNKLIVSVKKNYRMDPSDCNYIVFTGDIVDARGRDDESTVEYKDRIKASFELATNYFERLMKLLGVSPERLIMCPGNHDKFRTANGSDGALCGKNNDGSINESSYDRYAKAYDMYSKFVNGLEVADSDYRSSIYSVDDFNFLIMNSTWKGKEAEGDKNGSNLTKSFPRCVDCQGALDLINKNVKKLSKCKANNIVIVHDPSTNWCENSILLYQGKERYYVKEKLDTYFDYKLCGDIHTDAELDGFRSVSTKISGSDALSYGCIEYKNDKSEYHLHVIGSSGKERTKLNVEEKEKIIALSATSEEQLYIKELAFKLMKRPEDNINCTSVLSAIDAMMEMFINRDEIWLRLNSFFEGFSSFREYGDKERRIVSKSDLLINIINEIEGSEERVRLAIKSRPSQGKSTFLSLLYLLLLGLCFEGEFMYLPIYFNREKLNDKTYEEKIKAFDDMVNSANKMAETVNRPVCYILDGFNEYVYFEPSFDEYVYENYVQYEETESEKRKIFIIAIDTEKNNTNLKRTHLGDLKLTNKVLYLNNVEMKSLRTQTAERFFDNLNYLLDLKRGKEIADAIRCSGMEYVDMNLVVRHGSAFADGKSLDSIFELYGRNTKVFCKEDQAKIPKCAYQIIAKKTQYNMLGDDIKISYNTYSTLCRQREVGMYYCARYYFDEIKRLAKSPDEVVKADSILNNLFTHEQNIFLKILRDKRDVTMDEVTLFLKQHYSKLSYFGKSQIIYLYGRKKDENTGVTVFEKAGIHFETTNIATINAKDDKFKAEIMNRTIRVVKACEDDGEMENYILDLLKRPVTRKVNRATHMYYYSDVKLENAKQIYYENAIFKGFDIYHTFIILSNRLLNAERNTNLRLLDLVTLCDLIEHRFRQPIARTVNEGKKCDSYFYTDFYNGAVDMSPKHILNKYLETIKSFDLEKINNKTIRIYIEKCKSDAEVVLKLYEEGEKCLKEDNFHQSNAYESVRCIEKQDRKGWNIGDVLDNGTAEDEYEKKRVAQNIETVEQHIYQTYLIGLLYLPDEYPDISEADGYFGKYDKQKILNTILIHDIGECETGDWPNYFLCYNKVKSIENDFNNHLLIGGAFSETSNLIDYMDLWKNWYESRQGTGDINAVIARELDRIQFLYKFYLLEKEGKLNHFTPDRKTNIEKTRNKITTRVGKKILKIIIDENPHFMISRSI